MPRIEASLGVRSWNSAETMEGPQDILELKEQLREDDDAGHHSGDAGSKEVVKTTMIYTHVLHVWPDGVSAERDVKPL